MTNFGARIAARRGRGTVASWPRRRMRPAVVALEDRRLLSTFTVTSTADDGSAGTLRWAVGQADSTPGANAIDFDSTVFNTPLTITLTGGQLELSNTSGTDTVTGPAAGVTVSGGGLSRVFQVDSGVTATISGLTITGGSTAGNGGGVYNHGGTFTLIDGAVTGNSADYGGGLGTSDYGTSTLVNCTVTGNSSSENGGGLFNSYGTTTLSDCTVSGNYASANGGGLFSSFGTTALTNCTVSGNSAGNNGGGLYNLVGTTTLDYLHVQRQLRCERRRSVRLLRHRYAGLLHRQRQLRLSERWRPVRQWGTTTLTNCAFSGNLAGNNGGGLYNNGGTTTLTYGSVSGNVRRQ